MTGYKVQSMSRHLTYLHRHQDTHGQRGFLLIASLSGFGLALYRFGWIALNPNNVTWLMAGLDETPHFLGWHFFRHEAWSFPPGLIQGYLDPLGTSIGYTDSVPLLALILKLFAFLLPDPFQYSGPWMFACHTLQAVFGYLLMGTVCQQRWLQLIAGLFFVISPAMIFRVFHISLASHWLLVAGLWCYCGSLRHLSLRQYCLRWGLFVGIVGLVHPYLGIMVLAFAAAALLRESLFFPQLRVSVGAGVFGGLVCLLGVEWWLIGYFHFSTLDYGSLGFVEHALNLNAFVNPMQTPFTPLGTSRFLPNWPLASAGQYEGYAYFGAGMLLLAGIACILALRDIVRGHRQGWGCRLWQCRLCLRRLWRHSPLVLICIGFVLVSLTNRVTFGSAVVYEIPLGQGVLSQLASVFRGSGRFIWPVYYLLFYLILATVVRKLPTRWSLPVLGVCLLLQVADLRTLRPNLYQARNFQSRLQDAGWQTLSKTFERIVLIPPYARSLLKDQDYKDFSYLAAGQGKRVTVGYVARFSSQDIGRHIQGLLEQVRKDAFDRDTLYVFTPASYQEYVPPDPSLRCYILDGYSVCHHSGRGSVLP